MNRAFTLAPGDAIIWNKPAGRLSLLKRSGEEIDLNELCGLSSARAKFVTQNFTLLGFLHLCGLLAAASGITGYAVLQNGSIFACRMNGVPQDIDAEATVALAEARDAFDG